ncbi:PTS sugar transporter subunit IIB [Lacrimispora indolis]|jgi:fructoselysine and glucoselysine-specific PTS system IIB component|uniref:PTS sugar transporter subunit IIB n=1 Tax=Lacrimispora indolis TaxID=69825 RepID=UPI00356924B6|nr:PTS sugar transporter subunit IIB [Clostridiaceae bacterium]
MVKLVRVDHRLLHGQVVFIWTASIGVDCILIANDDVANDPIQKGILKLSQPTGVKLIFKSVKDSIEALNSGITDKYNLMIITSNVDDGYELASKVEQIRSLNLGNVKLRENTHNLSKLVHVTDEEEKKLKALAAAGIEVEIRAVPNDDKIIIK